MTSSPTRKTSSRKSPATEKSSEDALTRASSDLLRRVPPSDLEAEQAVLGGVFLRNDAFNAVLERLVSEDFYSPAHRILFNAMTALYEKSQPMDIVTVADQLRHREELDSVGGPRYLASLVESVPTAANIEFHADIVKEKAIRRRMIDAGSHILTQCFDPSIPVTDLLDESEQRIFSISEASTKPVFASSRQLVDEIFVQLSQRVDRKELVTGVPSGYHKFDEITAGFQASDLIIIAGRPGMGKTAFALNVALRAAIGVNTRTAIFSLEMSKEQLVQRMLCVWGKVDLKRLRTGFIDDQDWERLYQAGDCIASAPLYIDDTPALATMDLRSRCRKLKAEKGLDMVVVDYLQLMRSSRRIDSREQEISDISRTLKALAKELNVPVVALSQLNRKVEDRTSKRPMLSDLRESGAIEQDADLIVFLYREDAYARSEEGAPAPSAGKAEVIVGKQRNGPLGTVELVYLSQYTAFENATHMAAPSELM
ncbi:MAG: replicative DNA helicase [Deltaproteobacteria bacterium]|nr:replicative DNA helicase [Deltaproteobacteria bacterium]